MVMSCSDSRLRFRIASTSKSRSTRVLRVVAPVSVREKTIFSAFCQVRAKSRCFAWIALDHRRIPVGHRLIESPPIEIGSDRPHQLSDERVYLIGNDPIEGTGFVLNVTVERRIGDVDQLRHTKEVGRIVRDTHEAYDTKLTYAA